MEHDSHIAAHPAFNTIHRVVTQGRLLGEDINQLHTLGYDIAGALAVLRCVSSESIKRSAARGELTEHDLLDGIALSHCR